MATSQRKGITISSFRKVPAGLLLVLVFFFLTESFIYSNRPDLIKDWWNKFLINERELIDLPDDYDYLIIGDSIQKCGIDPTRVSDSLLSLGMPGGRPIALYLMLERYLKKHNPPKAIFLYVDPEDPRDSLLVGLRYFINPIECASVWNDLTWQERRVFMMRYWASLDLRKVNLTIRDEYPYRNHLFVQTMKRKRGYMPSPRADRAIPDDHFFKTKERYQESISISERDLRYLDKFVDLASSKGIKVLFLGLILPKELHAILEKSGFNEDYLSFYKGLKVKYPNAFFVKEPIMYLDNKYFGDASHVNAEGSEIYTHYFKNQLFVPLSNFLDPSTLRYNSGSIPSKVEVSTSLEGQALKVLSSVLEKKMKGKSDEEM